MSVNSYYRDELNYLREMGRIFAQANPRLSKHLANDATDPDVERLMEAFAFLVGRLRQRLDAEMPELAHALLQLVWPHYLRPVPPITTVAFRLAPDASETSIAVPRGTSVQTQPRDGETVEFRTNFDLTVLPFEITAVDLENRRDSSRLTLTFTNRVGGSMAGLAQAPLTLFINGHGDPPVARRLYLMLRERVRQVRFTAGDNQPEVVSGVTIEPVGFANGEATLPYPPGSFQGFRVMQEYFSCPEKFMYLRIDGLQRFAGTHAESFALSFDMSQRVPETSRLSLDQFALNATPVVNLFEAEGQALTVSHERSEYRVRAFGRTDRRSVHAVESVTGWVQGSGRRVDYEPFERFLHDQSEDGSEKLYYRTRVRPAVLGGGIDHYLSFVTRLDEIGMPQTETVSMRLICSNGPFASDFGIGTVNRPTTSTPSKLEFSNITPVREEVAPPLDDRVLWTLVANLARNFASLIDVDALRTVISAYDFRAAIDRQAAQERDLLLQSLRTFERRGADIVVRGRPVRAHELMLSVSEGQIGGEGEMYLFGTILDQFLKSYATVNSLYRFAITGIDSNTVYKWAPSWGEAATL